MLVGKAVRCVLLPWITSVDNAAWAIWTVNLKSMLGSILPFAS